MLFQSAEILGQLHEILKEYDLPVDMDSMWINEFNVSQSYANYDFLLDQAGKIEDKSTHGDYSAMQYLCVGDRIKAIIDFASAKKIPAVWEVMRSYMQSAKDTKDPFHFDIAKFFEYVRHYMSFSSLTEWDLKNMPIVYLYQLGRSRYGYKEYMTNAENKDDLLKFAF